MFNASIYIPVYGPIVMAMAIFPFFVIALLLRRDRPIFARLFMVYVSCVALFVGIIYADTLRYIRPIAPWMVIGPSNYTTLHVILPIIASTVWLPMIIVGVVAIILCRTRVIPSSHWLLDGVMIGGAILACSWIAVICFWGEFTHEDTRWAKGFSESKWNQIAAGMHRRTVYEIVGEPLDKYKRGLEEDGVVPECWATHQISGYHAAVWFTNDVVMKRALWWMD